MNKKLRIALSVLIAVAIPTSVLAQVNTTNFTINKQLFEVWVEPGELKELGITLTNNTSVDSQLVVAEYDFNPGIDGSPEIITSRNPHEYGLRTWVNSNDTIPVKAGETQETKTTLRVPKDAKQQSYFGVVTFKQVSFTSSSGVGAIVLAHVGEPSYVPGKVSLSYEQDGTLDVDTPNFEVSVKNEGAYAFKPEVHVNIIDNQGKVIETVKFEKPGNVMPKSERLYPVNPSSQLPEGGYTAQAIVSLPDCQVVASSSVAIANDAGANDSTEPILGDDNTFNCEEGKDPSLGTGEEESMDTNEEGSSFPILPVLGGVGLIAVLATVGSIMFSKRKKLAHTQEQPIMNTPYQSQSVVQTPITQPQAVYPPTQVQPNGPQINPQPFDPNQNPPTPPQSQ